MHTSLDCNVRVHSVGVFLMVFAKYSIMSNHTSLKQQLRYYRKRYISHTLDEKICYLGFLSLLHQSRIRNYFTTSVIGKILRTGPRGPQWWVRPCVQLVKPGEGVLRRPAGCKTYILKRHTSRLPPGAGDSSC